MKVPVMKIKCVDCGTEFEIDSKEKQWYENHGYELPKRCKDCRAKRKANKTIKK